MLQATCIHLVYKFSNSIRDLFGSVCSQISAKYSLISEKYFLYTLDMFHHGLFASHQQREVCIFSRYSNFRFRLDCFSRSIRRSSDRDSRASFAGSRWTVSDSCQSFGSGGSHLRRGLSSGSNSRSKCRHFEIICKDNSKQCQYD
jgi:hypothetical protein